MTTTYQILYSRYASKFTDETIDKGEIDRIGRISVGPRDMHRLPHDPRYFLLNDESGAILRYNTATDHHEIWKNLVEIFIAPHIGDDVINPSIGIWLDCQPPLDTTGVIDVTLMRETVPFAANLEREVRPFRERIARGQRCLFVERTAAQLLTYYLGVAMITPEVRVRNLFPGVAISANQERPAYAGGD